MATLAWRRVRTGFDRISAARDEGLHRVALRLAAQTVILLLVMLLALEVIVYTITQHALLKSLESTLQARAHQPDPSLCRSFNLPCGSPNGGSGFPDFGPGGARGPAPGQGRGTAPIPRAGASLATGANATIGPSDASAVYVDTANHVRHGDGVLGSVLLDPLASQTAMRSGRPQCCTTVTYRGESFRVYSDALVYRGKIVGAVQTSISEHQYLGTMNTLLQGLVLVTLLGLAGSAGISVLLTRRALQPIHVAIQRQRDFVADAAHELRTPLAIQRTVGEVGLGGSALEDQQTTIEQMLAENRHLTRLVDDLSLLARADSYAVALERAPLALSQLVGDTAAELAPLAEAEGISLTSEVQAGISMSADTTRLRQLLLILLDNALKQTPEGGTVGVSLSAHGNQARLVVSDTGPGIPQSDLSRIFDRFYQADQARTGKGSGLGLAIGRWIVEAHGGHIVAANGPGGGAVFTVTLPLGRSGIQRHETSRPRPSDSPRTRE